MLTRTAIYEGKILPGRDNEFFELVKTKLDPLWRQFPHVVAVRVLRLRQADPEAPPIPMILEMDFPSMEAIKEALDSPIRHKAHEATLEVLRLFEGRFYHLVSESRASDPMSPDDADRRRA